MKALKTFGFLGDNDPPRKRRPKTGVSSSCSAAARSCASSTTSSAQEMQRLRDRLKQQEAATGARAGNVRGAREAARIGRHRPIYPGFLSPARAVGRRARDHRPAGAGSRGQAGRARAQGVRARRQPQTVPAAPGQPSSSCARPNRTWSRRASSSRRSMRGSPGSTSGGIAGSGPRWPRSARRCRPAVDAAESAPARRARALRTDREGGRGRVPGHFGRGAARHQPRRHRLRRGVVPAPGAHHRWWPRRAPPWRGAKPAEYYGDLAACVSIMSDIVKARNLLKQRAGITQEVAQRTERLRATAAYLGEFETVPIPESCGGVRRRRDRRTARRA